MSKELDGLPEAVRRQAEETEKKLEAIRNQQNGKPADTPADQPEPVVDQVPPPAPSDPTPPPDPEHPAPVPPVREDWKQKFITLQGKYDAEVPRMAAEIRHLRQHTDQLTQQLSERTPVAPAAVPETPPDSARRFTTEAEATEFGQDLVDLQERSIKRGVEPLAAELKATREAVESMNRRVFFSDLAAIVPNFREINSNQEFLDYLNQTDELSGSVLDDILKDAQAKRDVGRVAAIFKRFVATHPDAAATPGQQTPGNPTPTPTRESLAQPPKQRGTPPARELKQWKTSELKQFGEDVSRGRYDKRPGEADRIQKEIDQAIREGRIVNDG